MPACDRFFVFLSMVCKLKATRGDRLTLMPRYLLCITFGNACNSGMDYSLLLVLQQSFV